jgi:o-succinylbenzoate synthase
LQFKFLAGTSKARLTTKDSLFIKVWNDEDPSIFGLGEFGPLSWLSPDYGMQTHEAQALLPKVWEEGQALEELLERIPFDKPGLRFALEMALMDLKGGGQRLLFPGAFTQGESSLLINGLVWMNEPEHMLQQAEDLVQRGFRHLKCKVGALDFQKELDFLKEIRLRYPSVELRLDANGAFSPESALPQLERLAVYDVHSIEQPIAPGQVEAMAELCKVSPIPIALDEELIGVAPEKQEALLQVIQPAYCIFKPMLLGGLQATERWMRRCKDLGIGWWLTSMLESNIGLNAIAQFAAVQDNPLPQGLGTGSLYTNNLPSPLVLQGPHLFHKPDISWDVEALDWQVFEG